MRRFLFPLLPSAALFLAGCLPTAVAGPDVPVAPDDGTVLVEGEKDIQDERDIRDEDEGGQPDAADVAELTDEVPDTELPDLDLPPVEVLFDEQVRPAVLAELGRARETVLFATYTFSDSGVLTKLNALAAQGVTVRGVAGTTVEAGEAGFPLKTYAESGNGIVHEKFFLIDGATALISSANIAYQQIKNFLTIVRNDPALAEALAAEFGELDAGRRGAAKNDPCDPDGCAVRDGTIYFSPGACDGLSSLLGAVPGAVDEAWLLMYAITDSAPMYDALLALPGEGTALHAVLDDWDSGGDPANQDVFEDLDAAGADVAYYGGDMVFHHKVFVTSSRALFGSMNWTYAGCEQNDEILFVSSAAAFVGPFLDYAQGL